jgi:lysozyme
MSEIIKHFEDCKLNSYLDSGGVATIGYGHTKGVKLGQTCTKEQAEKWLMEDLIDAENRVRKMFPNWGFPKHEWDALVSLAYNLRSFEKLAKHLQKDKSLFKKKMLEYYKTKGSERGLKRRRIAERLLFEGRDWLTVSKELDGKSLGEMMLREKELFS